MIYDLRNDVFFYYSYLERISINYQHQIYLVNDILIGF